MPADTKVPSDVKLGDSFVVFSDAQQFPVVTWFYKGGPKQRRLVRERIRHLSPDLLLFGGDAVAYGAYGPFWKQFVRDYHGMAIFPVIGNHDVLGNNDHALGYYFSAFPYLHGSRWYPLTFGPLRILMLDSNYPSLGPLLWKRQMDWLDERLAEAEQDPKVGMIGIVTHHPALSAIVGRGWHEVVNDIYPRAARTEKYRFHFSGHYHLYQHITDEQRHVFVTGGGGGPLYCGGTRDLPETAELVSAACSHHVIRGVLEEHRLRLETHILEDDEQWTIGELTYIPYHNSMRHPSFPPRGELPTASLAAPRPGER